LTPRFLDFINEDVHAVLTPASTEKLSPLKASTLAITGGTGFLGSWLLELVSVLNHKHNFGTEVVVFARDTDKFSRKRPHLASLPFVRLVKGDITYDCDLPRNTKWVIHAAANRDRRHHSSFPIQTMTVIAQGTERVLRSLESCTNLQMVANLSSGLVSGDQPLDMDRTPVGFNGVVPLNTVMSSYTEAKRYAELLCTSFRVEQRLPIINIRPFSFMGPYQTLESPWAVTSFIQDAIKSRPIRVLGNGNTTRSYMYPSDAAYWILRFLTAAESGRSYNLGSPEAVTLESLATAVATSFSPRPEILFSAINKAGAPVSRLVPDTTTGAEEFGLQVTVPFSKALNRTLDWFRMSPEA
jgi:nucleoside-diphosphate-sugar epimerase